MRRSPALFAATVLAASLLARIAHPDVILSELCDPQLEYNTDRFIEIYNTGPDPVDLTNWQIVAVANNVDVATWNLSGVLAADQAKVAGYTTPVTAFTVDFQRATWTAALDAFNWNGKIGDGAKLKNASGVVVDLVVAPGVLFENADLVRNPGVTTANPVFTASEWTATPVQYATDASPGSHNGSPPPTPGPKIANIVTDPAVPTPADPVDVQATVVDTAGAIVAVTMAWGPSSSSLPNVIGMVLVSDSTYRTSEQILPQPSGSTVYYQVTAEGATATSQSSVRSYALSGGAGTPPTILSVGQMSDSTLLVFFSEPVQKASAEVPTNYTVGVLAGVAAVRDSTDSSRVLVTVRNIAPGARTLTANGVVDLDGDIAFGATHGFNYVDVSIPPGYYDSAAGLHGSALRVALHNIIKNHTVKSYDYALTAFQTTDVKPNGKVWDMYSDVPDGTPPYEYSFGQTGQGATEGLGYNREHSWPQSWFNGSSPMYSDLYHLYPTDAKVNGYRANYPYGEVGVATTTSLNGSKLGTSVSPGYGGTVFEPIDAFKGDLARGQFYMATRYFGQDAGWPGSPSANGAEILPWAAEQYLQWSASDPPSWKERMRNGAVYVLQNNRNPFVDHPEFLVMIWDSTNTTGVRNGGPARALRLYPAAPNPFGSRTALAFDLDRGTPVALLVFDVTGRRIRSLSDGARLEPGYHRFEWDGRDDGGTPVGAGLYFYRLEAGGIRETRRMVVVR